MSRARKPAASEQRLLDRLSEVGVVLDFAFVESEADAGAAELLHLDAVKAGITQFATDSRIDPTIREPGPSGNRVSLTDFYGWHFDAGGSRRLRVQASRAVRTPWEELYRTQRAVKGSLNFELGFGPYQFADDDDPNRAIWVRGEITVAYAASFTNPPYRLRGLTTSEVQDLFLEVDELFLRRPTAQTEMWWWDGGPWTDYFLPGLEWWGAWAATVRTSPTEIVVIGASTSD